MKEVGVAVLAVLGALALIPVMIVAKAFIVVSIWTWFMVPFGAPALGIATAIGVMCVASFFNGGGKHEEKAYIAVLHWLITWLVAWVAHLFV